MNDINGTLQYKGKDYKLVFDLNVMEKIQEKYGSIQTWGEVTDGKEGEPDVKAVIYGFMHMINEGIRIDNADNGTDLKLFDEWEIGRIITEVGMGQALQNLNKTVIDSTQSAEKNA